MGNWLSRVKELGNDRELEKKIKVVIDIIRKIEEKGAEYFEKESRYHLTNKFSPKKLPEQQQK